MRLIGSAGLAGIVQMQKFKNEAIFSLNIEDLAFEANTARVIT